MSFSYNLQGFRTQLDKLLNNDNLMLPLAAFGVFIALSKVLYSARGVYRNVIQQPLDFRQMYQDKQSWVVITGGSNGIGFGFAEYFADLKFNIVMIARSKQKLEQQSKILEQKYGVQVKTISVDFSNTSINFYKYLAFQLKDLDVAIVINNVGGFRRHHFFSEKSKEEIDFILNINLYSTTFMTALVLPQLLRRNKRSAIINVGSGASSVPAIGRAMYGGSKAYVSQFSNILQNDLKYQSDKIDVLCFQPNFIQTNLQPLKSYVKVPQAVTGALKSLSRRTQTKGHWLHTFQEEFLTKCPLNFIALRYINNLTKRGMKIQS